MRLILHPTAEILTRSDRRDLLAAVAATVIGFALYGFTVGFWRSPIMGLYVALKMPLLIFCTLGCNGLLNGLLGMLLGGQLGIRQSFQALLAAFAISGCVLGSLAPVTFFLALNAPRPDSAEAASAHAAYLLFHTGAIGFAGLIGVARLADLLRNYCPSRTSSQATLTAWILGNAFLGAQFSWIFRPFFGSPQLEVAFLRPDPMRGSFYEALWSSAEKLVATVSAELVALLALPLFFFALIIGLRRFQLHPSTPSI